MLAGLPAGEGSGPGCGLSFALPVAAIDLVAGVVDVEEVVVGVPLPLSPFPFPFEEFELGAC